MRLIKRFYESCGFRAVSHEVVYVVVGMTSVEIGAMGFSSDPHVENAKRGESLGR